MRKDGEPGRNRRSSIGLGLIIGVALGAAMDRMGAGIALGWAIGVAIDMVRKRRGPRDDEDGS